LVGEGRRADATRGGGGDYRKLHPTRLLASLGATLPLSGEGWRARLGIEKPA
jgi:hypothetical protein